MANDELLATVTVKFHISFENVRFCRVVPSAAGIWQRVFYSFKQDYCLLEERAMSHWQSIIGSDEREVCRLGFRDEGGESGNAWPVKI